MHAQLSISEMPCHGEISGKIAGLHASTDIGRDHGQDLERGPRSRAWATLMYYGRLPWVSGEISSVAEI